MTTENVPLSRWQSPLRLFPLRPTETPKEEPKTVVRALVENTFRKELESLLNRYSKENGSNTPDFILANFLISVMDTYDLTVRRRDEWFKR